MSTKWRIYDCVRRLGANNSMSIVRQYKQDLRADTSPFWLHLSWNVKVPLRGLITQITHNLLRYGRCLCKRWTPAKTLHSQPVGCAPLKVYGNQQARMQAVCQGSAMLYLLNR